MSPPKARFPPSSWLASRGYVSSSAFLCRRAPFEGRWRNRFGLDGEAERKFVLTQGGLDGVGVAGDLEMRVVGVCDGGSW